MKFKPTNIVKRLFSEVLFGEIFGYEARIFIKTENAIIHKCGFGETNININCITLDGIHEYVTPNTQVDYAPDAMLLLG